jgi:hypothetical protein
MDPLSRTHVNEMNFSFGSNSDGFGALMKFVS